MDSRSSMFYFHVGNRSLASIIGKLNIMKTHLKHICFSRFCGDVVNWYEITQPEELVISFGFEVINGAANGIPSTTMVA